MTENKTLPLKTVAMEVFKEVKLRRRLSIIAIICSVTTTSFSGLNKWAGTISVGLVCMGFAWFTVRDTKYMQYLNAQYELKQKTEIINPKYLEENDRK